MRWTHSSVGLNSGKNRDWIAGKSISDDPKREARRITHSHRFAADVALEVRLRGLCLFRPTGRLEALVMEDRVFGRPQLTFPHDGCGATVSSDVVVTEN